MKPIKIIKHDKVTLPQPEDGVVAFQLIEYIVDFLGAKVTGQVDTKIMSDGKQFVHGGDGWLPDGKEIK